MFPPPPPPPKLRHTVLSPSHITNLPPGLPCDNPRPNLLLTLSDATAYCHLKGYPSITVIDPRDYYVDVDATDPILVSMLEMDGVSFKAPDVESLGSQDTEEDTTASEEEENVEKPRCRRSVPQTSYSAASTKRLRIETTEASGDDVETTGEWAAIDDEHAASEH